VTAIAAETATRFWRRCWGVIAPSTKPGFLSYADPTQIAGPAKSGGWVAERKTSKRAMGKNAKAFW
jgi:hypothetical protein